jgi:hypothetical protein
VKLPFLSFFFWERGGGVKHFACYIILGVIIMVYKIFTCLLFDAICHNHTTILLFKKRT